MDEPLAKYALYKPSELRQWLEEEALGPRKSLSQNFLIDGNIVKKIVQLADVQRGQVIIEIGPGPGVLTQELLALGADLVAIEADRKLCEKLERLGPLQAICADALKLDWDSLLLSLKPRIEASHAPLRLLSNLPYHLSTEMFKRLLPLGHAIERLVIMVQTEFAERLQAPIRTKQCGPLSLLREYCCTIPKSFKVPASCFFPRPRVESSVLRLDLIAREPQQVQRLEELLTCGFKHRRKTLKHAFDTPPLSLPRERIETLSSYFKKRAQELTLDEWLEILKILHLK